MFDSVVILSAFIVGFAKTSIGALSILAVPLMAIVYPAKESTGILLPMLIMADLFAVLFYRRHCNWHLLLRIFPVTGLGVIIGYLLMGPMPPRIFETVIASVILLMLVVELYSGWFETHFPKSRAYLIGVALLAGLSTMLANAAGPLLGMYFLQLNLDKNTFVGTQSWYFLLLNTYKVPFSFDLGLISAATLMTNLLMLPVILLGALSGYRVLQYLNLQLFRWLIRVAILASVAYFLLT